MPPAPKLLPAVVSVRVSAAPDLQAKGTTSTYIDYRHQKAFHGLFADDHVDTIKRANASQVVTQQAWRMSNQMP